VIGKHSPYIQGGRQEGGSSDIVRDLELEGTIEGRNFPVESAI
jgi:hypothetical protein